MARRSGFPKIGELRIHNQLQASKHLIRPEWFLERMAIIRRLAGAERYDLDIVNLFIFLSFIFIIRYLFLSHSLDWLHPPPDPDPVDRTSWKQQRCEG